MLTAKKLPKGRPKRTVFGRIQNTLASNPELREMADRKNLDAIAVTHQFVAYRKKHPRRTPTSEVLRFLLQLPPAGKRLADVLEYRPGTVAAVRPANGEARRREIEIRNHPENVIVEVMCSSEPQPCGDEAFSRTACRFFLQTFSLRLNCEFSRGDIETIFSLGLRAMHRLRADMAPRQYQQKRTY